MQRERRFRYRLAPYGSHRLPPPCENPCTAAVMDVEPLATECDSLHMHNPPGARPPSLLLEGDFELKDCSEGVVSITDQRFATIETLTVLTPKYLFLEPGQVQVYDVSQAERTVYKVRWEGGGSLTVRVF
ncbi:ORF6/7 [Simian adenovirus 16]|uniref:ORF6/7 n=1 Tax=Simian adenovirus 16 TaxID=1715778 RepID=A0A0M4MTZ2_9ADEN|nr:ORF6/7 [Simian adenovirus 16]ALE30414.1 ORF6/7 [Simian adenovirus 16]